MLSSQTSFQEKLSNNSLLIGTIVTLSHPSVSEILSHCGFDWLFIDMEHAPLEPIDVLQLLQTKHSQCAALVRVPSNDPVWIKRVLDLGPEGIIVPQIQTPQEAQAAITACLYPPQGTRSVGVGRAQGYGNQFQEYLDQANSTLTIVLQIEHIKAAENIEAILAIKGIGGIFIGPYDLSASMDLTGQTNHPEVIATINKIKQSCHQARVPVGIYAPNTETAQKYIANDFEWIAIGMDTILLRLQAQTMLNTLKKA